MNWSPANLDALRKGLANANAKGSKIERIDLSAFGRLLAHTPEDMTCTVETGMTLAALQKELSKRGQWLPIDPSRPEKLTIGQLLANNESGPHRFGYGTIREHLLGITVATADGRLIKSGGKVVKNVAGFDLCKLFVGSKGSLGVIVEATFKLQPLPETEAFAVINCDSLKHAEKMIELVMESDLTPVVLDLHNLTALQLVLAFAGGRENVEWQTARAVELHAYKTKALDYFEEFWRDANAGIPQRRSVLPSRITEVLSEIDDAEFVAHAGNGLIWHRGGATQSKPSAPSPLAQRVKDAFDPKHIFPEIPA